MKETKPNREIKTVICLVICETNSAARPMLARFAFALVCTRPKVRYYNDKRKKPPSDPQR